MGRVVLTDGGEFAVADGPGLWLTPGEAERVAGWAFKPEGMCRGDLCVPLPATAQRDGLIDMAAFWALLGAPVASDAAGKAWVLGTGATDRTQALGTLDAPDFELQDIAGTTHRLSALRGKKVFLATWASW